MSEELRTGDVLRWSLSTVKTGDLPHETLSQREAARILGISPQYLHDIIANHRRLTPELANAWCEKVAQHDRETLRQTLHRVGAQSDGWDVEAIIKSGEDAGE
jgi:plasmid maintenance system antidote protein VapI